MSTDTNTATLSATEIEELQQKVQEMYRVVAEAPGTGFHFEIGRALAERLGYPAQSLDAIPGEAVDSFAGVGYHMEMADIRAGETVLDLGSGSGMDSFVAALATAVDGRVIGVDMTEAQLNKATRLATQHNVPQVEFRAGYLELLPIDDASVDVVISNGVINLCADKSGVFTEISRVLRTGGRVALSDIVTAVDLPAKITCDTTLWAACIGGAMQQDRYRNAMEDAGLEVVTVQSNDQYRFLSRSAQGASRDYGVRSVSILAVKR